LLGKTKTARSGWQDVAAGGEIHHLQQPHNIKDLAMNLLISAK